MSDQFYTIQDSTVDPYLISSLTGTIDLTNLSPNVDYIFDSNLIDTGVQVSKGDLVVKDGDILMGSTSLKNFVEQVSQRLNILQVNPALEADWEELRSLGEAYRKLEAEILEKQAIWNRLKG